MNKIQDALERYLETRIEHKDKKDEADRAYRAHAAAKSALVEAMLEAQQSNLKPTEDSPFYGLSLYLSTEFSIACNAENEQDVKEWLHERYGDLSEFTEEKVKKARVEERLKDEIDAEQLDEFDIPEFFKLKTRPNLGCRGFDSYYKQRKQA